MDGVKEEHLAAGTGEPDQDAEENRAAVVLEPHAGVGERIDGRGNHGERPDDVHQRVGKSVLGRAPREGAPDTPERGRHEREDEPGPRVHGRLSTPFDPSGERCARAPIDESIDISPYIIRK